MPRTREIAIIDRAPTSDLPPLNLFRIETAATSSTRAPPIAARPLPISSHDISPNFCNALARIRQLTANASSAILAEMGTLEPLIPSSAATKKTSPTPSAISALAMSRMDKSASFFIAPAIMPTATAISTRDPPALTRPFEPGPLKVFEIDFIVPVSIPSIAPIATSDFVISPTSRSAIVFMDAARMPTAIATATIDETLIPSEKEDNVS